ncbi:MAG: hypothetical protein ACRC5H_03300, partial [Treponemataceae bacterium]
IKEVEKLLKGSIIKKEKQKSNSRERKSVCIVRNGKCNGCVYDEECKKEYFRRLNVENSNFIVIKEDDGCERAINIHNIQTLYNENKKTYIQMIEGLSYQYFDENKDIFNKITGREVLYD